jgi:DNA topoisomerase-1
MPEQAHIIAGRCTAVFAGEQEQRHHGDMVVLVKPDNTVLVHDADGYQPVTWLTRPDSVTVTDGTVAARDGEQSLTVTVHDVRSQAAQPLSEAGLPVADCPDCGDELLRASNELSCPDCATALPIPRDATVLEECCPDCGLPRVRVERGCSLVCCPDCESLTDRVREAFDRHWDCPDCKGELRVLYRGGLLLGCDRYPDCEVAYSFPTGIHDGECGCGLPVFETATGRRCLDSGCEAHPEPAD